MYDKVTSKFNFKIYCPDRPCEAYHFYTFEAAISFIIDMPISLKGLVLSQRNQADNGWEEWKSLGGKSITFEAKL